MKLRVHTKLYLKMHSSFCFKPLSRHLNIQHPSARVQQYDFLSNRTVFKINISEQNPSPLTLHWEVCKTESANIEELFSHH